MGKTQLSNVCNELKHDFSADFNLVSHFNVKYSQHQAHFEPNMKHDLRHSIYCICGARVCYDSSKLLEMFRAMNLYASY